MRAAPLRHADGEPSGRAGLYVRELRSAFADVGHDASTPVFDEFLAHARLGRGTRSL